MSSLKGFKRIQGFEGSRGRVNDKRINILDLSREQLVDWLAERGIAAYRAGQILKWIYRRQKDSFAEMSDIAKDVRALLPQHFRIPRLEIQAMQTSADGTRKYLFGLADGERIESVLIPERDHYTLCVSSQVGCAQNCRFCLTAKSKLRRNLAQGEILGQVRDIKKDLPQPEQLTNLVFMGMGEPLANFDHLLGALQVGRLDVAEGGKLNALQAEHDVQETAAAISGAEDGDTDRTLRRPLRGGRSGKGEAELGQERSSGRHA